MDLSIHEDLRVLARIRHSSDVDPERALLRECAVLRGALKTACTVIRKLNHRRKVDAAEFLLLAGRTLAESKRAADDARFQIRAARVGVVPRKQAS